MGYPTDLTDTQWELIEDLFSVGNYGTSRKYPVRVMINAVFYLTKTGCQWRMLPKDFPPYPTVWSFYRRLSKDFEITTKSAENMVMIAHTMVLRRRF